MLLHYFDIMMNIYILIIDREQVVQGEMEKKKHHKYAEYRALSPHTKHKRIKKAVQQQKYRASNPQGITQFHQLGFFDFHVLQKQKKIRLQTYRHHHTPNTPLKALIFMFHGLNSHVGHGAHLAQILSKHGYDTVGYDYRGFGRSQGIGGYVQSFDQHIQQAHYFVKQISKMPEYQLVPKFALGLSMGGMTIYHLSLKYPKLFKGVILMAPAMMHSMSSGLVSVAKTIGKVLPDKAKLFKPIYGQATKNPQITQDVQKDKYAFSERSVVSTMQLLVKIMDSSPKTFHRYNCPFIIIQGGLDKLVNPQVAFELYDNAKTQDQHKQIVFYENMWHDIWHEPEIFDIMEKVIEWINKQIDSYDQKQTSDINSQQKIEQSLKKMTKQAQVIQLQKIQQPENKSQQLQHKIQQ